MTDAQPKLTLSQRKRLDILAAARGEFLETNFRDTSMDRIAERAQVSKRTVYNHFPSKEMLFSAIAGQFIAEMQQAVTLDYDPQRPVEKQLRELATREAEQVTAEDYVAIFRLFLAEIDNLKSIYDGVMAQTGGGHDPVEVWMQAAIDDGALSIANAKLATNQFISLLKGALFWPLVAGYGEPRSQAEISAVIDGAVGMFMDHYGPQA
jgi:TetR/AcrR family transcriptional regulator of autoinduction and epiphytic fitness